MVSGKVVWKRMDIKVLIQGMVNRKMEYQHKDKGISKKEMDQGLEVNLVEQDLSDIEISQEEMVIDQDLNQGGRVN